MQCQQCGHEVSAEQNFCSACGYKLKPSPTPVNIIAATGEKEELKHVTILFSDIKGSTQLTEKLEPEEAHKLLKPLTQAMIDAVFQYDGTVIHTAGDGIVALFGAPKALEDHALRACYAALAMQHKVQLLSNTILIRVGINSGEVVLDIVGSEQHREYDATGPAVNLAARLEQTATPGRIHISQNTLRIIKDFVKVTTLDAINVKGFTDAIPVFELNGILTEHLTAQHKQANILELFVGRDQEIKQLKKIIGSVLKGKGEGAAISGEAGQGKSRLVNEVINQSANDFTVIFCSGLVYDKAPLLPVIHLLQKLLGVSLNQSQLIVKNTIKQFITKYKIKQQYAMSALLALLGFATDDIEWDQLYLQIKRKHSFAIIIDLLKKYSAVQSLLLVFEDLDSVDTETIAFIELLIQNLAKSSILILLTYRSDYNDAFLKSFINTFIRLEPLDITNSKKICNNMMGDNISLVELKERLLTRADGNPLFLEEMIKDLINDKILIGRPGGYSLNATKLAVSGGLPETIYAVVHSQMDRLPALQKSVLQKISVLGQRFNYSLCLLLTQMDAEILRPILNQLLAQRFILEAEVYPETIFTFKHALIQEAIYYSLLKSDRKQSHIEIVTIIENNYPDKISDYLEALANHAFEAQLWQKAFEYNFMAAQKAFNYSAHQESIVLYEKALTAAEFLPKTPVLLLRQIKIYIELFHASYRRCIYDKPQGYLLNALVLAEELNDPKIKNILQSAQAAILLAQGETLEAERELRNIYLQAAAIDTECIITAGSFFQQTYLMLGRYEDSIAIANSNLEKIPGEDYTGEYIRVKYWYVAQMFKLIAFAASGAGSEINKLDKQLAPLLKTKQLGVQHFCIALGLGIGCLAQKQLDKADKYLNLALRLSQDFGMRNFIPIAASALGYTELLQGKGVGQEHLELAIEKARAINFLHLSVFSYQWIIEGLLLLDETVRAKELLTEALEICEQRNVGGLKVVLEEIRKKFV